MEMDHRKARAFLYELCTQTGGDCDVQVSMYDIGTAVGLEKDDVELISQSLYIQGLAEMKTLSGGIGITVQGLAEMDIKVEVKKGNSYQLPTTKVLEQADRVAVDDIVQQIKTFIGGVTLNYDQMEALVIDIKCVDIQMLSARPKTEVIRQLLLSCKDHLDSLGAPDLIQNLEVMIGT